MSYLQDILSEYTRMRENGLETKTALQALRSHIESLHQNQRAELAALIRTWESRSPAPPAASIPSPVPPPANPPPVPSAVNPPPAPPAASIPSPLPPEKTMADPPPKPSVIRPLVPRQADTAAPSGGVPTQPIPDITWVQCPNCGKPNQQHEVFCYACGQLLEPIKGGGVTKHFTDIENDISSEYFGPESVLALRVRGSSDVYELRPQRSDHELVIGRSSRGSAIMPDLDLANRQAADLGVSRMHVALRYEADQNAVLVSDLGSANGTFIGGQRLLPKEIRVLRHGDELRLGKLMLMVSFRHPGKPSA